MVKSSRPTASIPFTSEWKSKESFDDLPASSGVSNPVANMRGWTVTRDKALGGTRPEAEVYEWNTVQAALLGILATSRRAVARILVPGGQVDYLQVRKERGWHGTGFLVARNLLLTNHHVLNSEVVAAAATVEFDYEIPGDRLAVPQVSEPATARFELTPSRLFITSPLEGGLDYTFVWINEKASETYGTVPMQRGSFMISPYEPVFIIHHPGGEYKQVSLDDTEVLAVNAVNVLYAADTQPGSSGACVLNRNGTLVALHHASQSGAAMREAYPDGPTLLRDQREIIVANEGVKISAIAIDLEVKMRGGSKDAESAAEVLGQIEGSDTLTGIFGAIGRQHGGAGADRVRGIYGSTDQDADIGFWNMQWLLPGVGTLASADEAVTAMVDLNQDVWFLTDVPPAAVTRIVRGMSERFDEQMATAFAEPDAHQLQSATAVIWRPSTISCTRVAWPAAVLDAFARPVATADRQGALFSTPPGLFELRPAPGSGTGGGETGSAGAKSAGAAAPQAEAADAALIGGAMGGAASGGPGSGSWELGSGAPGAGLGDWRVRITPVSLRSVRVDQLQRRLVSKLMARAIEMIVEEPGDDVGPCDWIVGGDVEPPLVHEDLEPLRKRKFRTIAATDKRRGSAINYLRTEASGIRAVFVTSDLRLVDNQGDFFEVIEDRTVDKYIFKLADNRPAVLRLARGFGHGTTSSAQIDKLVDFAFKSTASPSGASPASSSGSSSRHVRADPQRARAPERSWSEGLVWQGLDKREFLTANRAALAELLSEVASRQGAAYPELSPLSDLDLWVLTYAEAGLGANGVDPAFRHSNGEIGLYPLPSNINFWIGSAAPAWDAAMPIETNVEAYALYLGEIRNKTAVTGAGGRRLYRDLFRAPGIDGSPERQARLLAGIVHGYFVSVNYPGRAVPFERILMGFARDEPVDSILGETDYVHAGSSILVNRQRNIDAALADHAAT